MRIEVAALAETYRKRAEELRADCSGWPQGRARTTMDQTAREYDRMARNLERRAGFHLEAAGPQRILFDLDS